MYARAMETYLLQVVMIRLSRYLTNENPRLSKLSMIFTQVIFLWFMKLFLITNCYYIDSIFCVRWSPSGDMIASASQDQRVALLDFKTGKKLYTGNTSDGSKFSLFD